MSDPVAQFKKRLLFAHLAGATAIAVGLWCWYAVESYFGIRLIRRQMAPLPLWVPLVVSPTGYIIAYV